MNELKAEHYFLRYAFPCAYVLCDQGRMTQQDYELLKKLAKHGGDISFTQLEEYFPQAFRRIKEVAQKLKKDYTSIDVIRAYFLDEHNKYIDKGDGMYKDMPDVFCEFCKVKKERVEKKRIVEGMLFVRVGKERWVRAPFFEDTEISVGDKVTVHHAFAVEKITA